jgi:hypothetical protein
MDHITLTPDESLVAPVVSEKEEIIQVDLNTVEILDTHVAFNVLIGYLNIAQKRGVFSLNESAKIWECIQKFIPV